MQTVSIPKLIYSRATIWAAKPLEKGSVDASTQLMFSINTPLKLCHHYFFRKMAMLTSVIIHPMSWKR